MRRDMWLAAGQMWRDHFWWGVGPAHYDYRFREYRPERIQMQPDRAHNDYLNLLADWGTAGGLIVLAGMAVFGAGLWQNLAACPARGKGFRQRAEQPLRVFSRRGLRGCWRWRCIRRWISTCTFRPTRWSA